MHNNAQVIISGGGPVGLALAVDLGLRGISCVLVERSVGSHRIPKGQNLAQRTLENFYFWGLVDELRARRIIPRGFPGNFIVAYGNLMGEYWYPSATRSEVDEFYFQKSDRLPQYLMEQVLIERVRELPSVTMKRGWSVTGISQDADGVAVDIAHHGNDAIETLRADYAVGCDGSHSFVRAQLGLTSHGTDYEQTMVLAVFRSRALHEALARFPPAFIYRVMHKDLEGYWRFLGRVDDSGHWFFHTPVPAGTDRDEAGITRLLEQAAGMAFECSFDHIGFWDLRVSIAERFRAGRVFIAGDAAHSHPPYGGYGLNTGLDDAVNLGWKLGAMLDGWGGETLLASYDEERRSVATETSAHFIDRRIVADRDFFRRYNPESDPDTFARMWKSLQSTSGKLMLNYAPQYEGSPVVAGKPGGQSGARGSHSHRARTGHHLPPWKLSSGRDVFEELGRGFTLIALDAEEDAPARFLDAAQETDVPLKLIVDRQPTDAERRQSNLMLVRPDRHIAWADDNMPDDPHGIMRLISGRSA